MVKRSQGTGLSLSDWEEFKDTISMYLRRTTDKGRAIGYAEGIVQGYNEGYLDGIHNNQPKYATNDIAG